MADDAVIRLGYDNSKVRKGAKETEAIMKQTAGQVEKTWAKTGANAGQSAGVAGRAGMMGKGGKGGGALRGAGNVGMQLQDVAVQAQMGASAATIIGQQGSQMLGALGPAGMIAGAVVAVGAGLYSMGESGKKAFKEMDIEGKKFEKTAKNLVASGDLSGLIQNYDMFGDRIKDLGDKAEKSEAIFGRLQAGITSMMGGPSTDEQRKKTEDARIEAMKLKVQAQKEIVKLSEQDVGIARMRAEGDEDGADAAERQLELQKEISRINATNLGNKAKEQLIANATEKSQLGEQKKANEEQKSNEDFMKDFRFRRAVLREKGQAEKAQSMTMNSSFDGKRRGIQGYTGGAKSGQRLGGGGGWTGTSFNEFFNAEETQFGQKSGKQMSDQTFDEFFNPRGKKSAVKNTSTTNTRIRDGQIPQSDKILQDIRDGINLLASY